MCPWQPLCSASPNTWSNGHTEERGTWHPWSPLADLSESGLSPQPPLTPEGPTPLPGTVDGLVLRPARGQDLGGPILPRP